MRGFSPGLERLQIEIDPAQRKSVLRMETESSSYLRQLRGPDRSRLTVSDLIADEDFHNPPITVKRAAQVDAYNIDQIQYFDRNSDYAPSVASEPLSLVPSRSSGRARTIRLCWP